jgi:DNA polymerase
VALTPAGSIVVWVNSCVVGTADLSSLNPDSLWPDGYERQPLYLIVSENCPPEIGIFATRGYTFIAHNAFGFDAACWERHLNPSPRYWNDTAPMARAAGLPGGLDQVSKRLWGKGKDEAKAILKRFTTAKHTSQGVKYCEGEIGTLRLLLRYNVADVLLLKKLYDVVKDHGEADVIDLDVTVNRRGVSLDTALAETLIEASEIAEREAIERIVTLTRRELTAGNIRSRDQVLDWCSRQGVRFPDLKKKTVERFAERFDTVEESDYHQFLESIDPDATDSQSHRVVAQVLRERQTVGRITKKKLGKALATVSDDGRLRQSLVYYGAHTGRWSGRGFQPHNLTKSTVKGIDFDSLIPLGRGVSVDTLVTLARGKGTTVADVVAAFLRPVFKAGDGKTLLIADFAGIEARGVAWCAGQEDLLDVFRRGGDPYCEFASTLFGRTITKKDEKERGVGKIGILGCGYQMSGAKLGIGCVADGIDLGAVGVTAEQIVETYRDCYPKIAGYAVSEFKGHKIRRGGLWQRVQETATRAAAFGVEGIAGRCRWFKRDEALICQLPSLREIVYHDAKIVDREPVWGGAPRPTLVYTSPRGEQGLYGGKLTENIVQAICRDLMATALVLLESMGLNPVLHVHDEIVCEVPQGREQLLDTMLRIMSDPPGWADGFPIKVEGWTAPIYTKGPLKSSYKGECESGSSR